MSLVTVLSLAGERVKSSVADLTYTHRSLLPNGWRAPTICIIAGQAGTARQCSQVFLDNVRLRISVVH